MPGEPRGLLRLLGVVGLLVVVAVGVAAARHAPTSSGIGVHGAGGPVVTLGVVVVVAGAAMALAALRVVLQAARRRRGGEQESVIAPERRDTFWQRLGALLMLVIVLGLALALAFAVGRVHFAPDTGAGPTGSHTSPPTAAPSTVRSSEHGSSGGALVPVTVGARAGRCRDWWLRDRACGAAP
jgi:hypothetical protein